MQFEWMNKGLLMAYLKQFDPHPSEIIRVQEELRTELLIGTVTKSPNTNDDEAKDVLHVGASILVMGFSRSFTEFYVQPMEGQKLMEPGLYAVSLKGVIGVLDAETVEDSVLSDSGASCDTPLESDYRPMDGDTEGDFGLPSGVIP